MADSAATFSSQMSPFQTDRSSSSPNSFESWSINRGHGLIKQSRVKTLRRDLLQLFGYVYATAPSVTIVHLIVTFIRILQFIGPAFVASYESVWDPGSDAQRTMNILAIFYGLIPPTEYEACFLYVHAVYIAVVAFVIIMLLIASAYFKRYAKLPSGIPLVITIYFATFGEFLHPIAINFVFYGVSALIWRRDSVIFVETIALCVTSFVLSLVYFWIVLEISNQNLVFRPHSLMSATTPPQNFIFMMTIVVTALVSFGQFGPKILQLVVMSVAAIMYAVSTITARYRGGFIHHYASLLVVAGGATSFLFLVMGILVIAFNLKMTLVGFFIDLGFWAAVLVVAHLLLRKSERDALQLLELIQEDQARFAEKVTSTNQLLNLVVIGFRYAHPVCLDWTVLKMGVDRWPQCALLWYLFAKFAAIYPEETQCLSWIFHRIVALKVRGSAIRTIKEQALSITRQRETNLNTDLRAKLNTLSRQVQPTKHRLRHVWDVVIQGNINEVEISTKRAIQAIRQNDADFKHLYRQYPNNRFVTRAYSRFLLEVAAEHVQANDMMEKTRLLQRCIAVNSDQTHELGMETFNLLPDRVKMKKEVLGSSVSESAGGVGFQDCQDPEEEVSVDLDQLTALKHRIEELTIPGVVGAIITRIILILAFFVVPAIVGLVYIESWTNQQEPIAYVSQLAVLRTYVYQLSVFSIRYMGESLGIFAKQDIYPDEPLPETLGSTWNTQIQTQYIISQSTTAIQDTTAYRALGTESDAMALAHELLFGNTIEYIHADSPNNYTTKKTSLPSALMDFIVQLNPVIMNSDPVDGSIVNTSAMLNLVLNSENMVDTVTTAIDYLIEYIRSVDDKTKRISVIVMSVFIVFVVFMYLFCLVGDIYWLKVNKRETYSCMAALPKNTVSVLAENLRIMKRAGDENSSATVSSDVHKQEENILKIFNIGAGVDLRMSDMLGFIIITFIIIGLFVASTVLMAQLVTFQSGKMRKNVPHIDSLLGAYAQMMGGVSGLLQLLFEGTPYRIMTDYDYSSSISRRLSLSRKYIHLVSFGGAGSDELPFVGLTEGLASARESVNCGNTAPTTLLKMIQCYPVDTMFMTIEPLILSRINLYDGQHVPSLDPSDAVYDAIWHVLIHPLYNDFFWPLSEGFTLTVSNELEARKTVVYQPVIVMMCIAVILELFAISQIHAIGTHIREVLKLLLHCPPDVVLSTPRIVKVLAGNFIGRKSDSMDRYSEFFDIIFAQLPDAILYADSDMNVQAANEACAKIFGEQEIVGQSLTSLFSTFMGNTKGLVTRDSRKEMLVMKRPDGVDVQLEVTTHTVSGKMVVIMKDVTQMARYNTLIREEREKTDQLLSTILPCTIVRRIQEGEKNISFAVQSASIVFIDIVDFNTWGMSVPPSTVMTTLTDIFARFDALIANKPTMTKIKSIGDCYMAAGGIFSEVNQPAEHAKEAVAFGLEAIKAAIEFGKEQGQKPKVRVGANTGGPIVAGVLSVSKPTFEIIGTAINLAQQMEHHGIPMAVHITRSVYELIYGDTFTIRERGTVEVRGGGTLITYIVTQKN